MLRIIIILFLFSSVSFSQSIKFPSYLDVKTKIEKEYEPDGSDVSIKLEKKPEGWFISRWRFQGMQSTKASCEQLWSSKDNEWKSISFKISTDSKNSKIIDSISEANINKYNIYPYFGYRKWSEDVIYYYINNKCENDTSSYILFDAYKDAAIEILNQNKNENLDKFIYPNSELKLSSDELKLYNDNFNKADSILKSIDIKRIFPYNSISELENPETDLRFRFFNYLLISNLENEALKFLAPNLFSEKEILEYKTFVNQCDTNSILFVESLKKSCILLYLQYYYKIREDIIICVYPNLNIPSYVDFLRNKNKGKLVLNLTPKKILDESTNVIYLKNSDIKSNITDLIKYISETQGYPVGNSSNMYFFPTNNFNLKKGSFKINEPHILRSNLVFLDIINSNKNKAIYFSNEISNINLCGLDKYIFKKKGIDKLIMN